MGENLHQGHRQRVRARYIKEGLDAFQDHQVLEMLLFYSIPRKDTNELAHKMLQEYGSLVNLFEAHPLDIVKRCGVNEITAVLLSLIPSLSRRYNQRKWGEKPDLSDSSRAGKYATSLFIGKTYECFYVICLDAQNRVNCADLVHEGTINETPVYPRIIVEKALLHKANSIILAHNHPGGSLRPSSADIEVTHKIKDALNHIKINVVDHIIVAGDRFFSFAENRML